MPDGKIAGVGNKTLLRRFPMQLHGAWNARGVGDGHDREQGHVPEVASAVVRLDQGADRFVPVVRDYDIINGAEMQIPQHMTRGKCCYKKLFWIVSAR